MLVFHFRYLNDAIRTAECSRKVLKHNARHFLHVQVAVCTCLCRRHCSILEEFREIHQICLPHTLASQRCHRDTSAKSVALSYSLSIIWAILFPRASSATACVLITTMPEEQPLHNPYRSRIPQEDLEPFR